MEAIAARHGDTKQQGIGKANGKDGLLDMKNQPGDSAPSALRAPRCMASLAQVITHVHQYRFKSKTFNEIKARTASWL